MMDLESRVADLKRLVEIRNKLGIEKAKESFYEYNRLKAPEFYKKDRLYLKEVSEEMQTFLYDDTDILIINMPPRHGKSRTGGNFVEWVLGKMPYKKIMTGSYNEMVSMKFSKSVRNTIMEEKATDDIVVYNDIFPRSVINRGDGSLNLWNLSGMDASYLATSPTGTATGFGADLLILDDLIKSKMEAFNATTLENHWDWFTNTMLSRMESGGKILVIMTRWHSNDLAGRITREMPEKGYKIKVITEKALQDDGTMLCDEILSYKEYLMKSQTQAPEIVEANYNQKPIDIRGKLYNNGFKTYTEIPQDKRETINYTDTADEGGDYLCSITADVSMAGDLYVTDVVYLKDDMEITENVVAQHLYEFEVNRSIMESNNGGRGFMRAVQNKLKTKYGSNRTTLTYFHQSKNKQARIISNATWVMEHVLFPEDWRTRWPEYYNAMNAYQREGKNLHDDAPDATTGLAESVMNKIKLKTFKGGL